MEQKISLDQGIETPILLKQGIECKALLLDTDGEQNYAILLDNVSDEWAQNLQGDTFLRLSPNRFITTKPIASLNWGAIFPGVKTQFTQPTPVKASKVGKTIGVPPEVQDQIKEWSDDHIRALIQTMGDRSYVASFDVYRHSAIQGHIEKNYVATILEAAAESVIALKPHALHLVAFLNELYRESGQDRTAVVDTARIFEILSEDDSFEDTAITGALPDYLSRNERLSCWIDRQQCVVVVHNSAAQNLSFHQFDALSGCYRFCSHEKYTVACDETSIKSIKKLVDAYRCRWPWNAVRGELVQVAQESASRFCQSNGHRFIYEAESGSGDRIFYADPHSRLIFTWSESKVSSFSDGVEQWLSNERVGDSDLRYLIWGDLPDQGNAHKETESDCPYPTVDLSQEDCSRVDRRRLLVSDRYLSPLYHLESNRFSLAQRITLFHFYHLVTPNFVQQVQSQSSAERFCGAVELVGKFITDLSDTDLHSLLNGLKLKLEQLGYLDTAGGTGLVSTLTGKGKQLISDLQCASIDIRQKLVRFLSDESYQTQHLSSLMSLNWPYESQWWVVGFEFFMENSGWTVARQGQRFFQAHRSRESAVEALKLHITRQRVREVDDGYYFYSKQGMRYRVPEGFSGEYIDGVPNVLSDRPEKAKLTCKPTEDGFSQLAIAFDGDDLLPGVEEKISSAFHDMSRIIGIPQKVVSFEGSLEIHGAGDNDRPQLALWSHDTIAHCPMGGIAAAWGEIYYGLLAGDPEAYSLYFPEVKDSAFQVLLEEIQYIDKPYVLSAHWLAMEREVVDEIQAVYGFEPQEMIGNLSPEAFTELLAALDIKDDAKPLISKVMRLRANTGRNEEGRATRKVHSPYLKACRKFVDLSADAGAIQGRSLFARAFEAWVEDSLIASGVSNDVLVYGTRNEDRLGFDIYPEGGERYRIGRAFDRYFLQSPDL